MPTPSETMTRTPAVEPVRSAPSNGTALPPILSREQLAARPLRTVDVLVGEGRLRFRALKQSERERLDDEALDKNYDKMTPEGMPTIKLNNLGFQTKACAMGCIFDDGRDYFASVDEGMAVFGAMDDVEFGKIWEAIDKLNILTPATRAALGKDSGATTSSSSS